MMRTGKIFRFGALTAAAVLYLITTTDVAAQSARNCAPRDVVIERLQSGYGETRQSVGLGVNNTMVEVFASSETGSWTITVTRPGGQTCMIASGRSYEALSGVPVVQEKDA